MADDIISSPFAPLFALTFYFGRLFELGGGRRRKAKEFQIGGNLLEQHIKAWHARQPPRFGGGEKGRPRGLEHHLADESRRPEAGRVHGQWVARMGSERRRIDRDVETRRGVRTEREGGAGGIE